MKNKVCSIKQIPLKFFLLLIIVGSNFTIINAQDKALTPLSAFGHEVGADYSLINYEQSIEYFKNLAASSNRMQLIKVGYTSFERPWYMAVISTPQNLRNLEQLRQTNQLLAHPGGLSEAEAKKVIKDAPVFVDINGGLHAAEIAGSQHTNQFAFELMAMSEAEFHNYFDKMVLFLWPTLNPDGQNIVVDWYNQIKDTEFKTAPLPEVYQKYIGHDNNRDGYMLNMQESRVLARTWRFWEPEILHVHHQQGRSSARNDYHRIWLPPFSSPVGVHTPYRLLRQMNTLGMQMAQELETRGLHGATHLGESYDAFYAGYNDYVNMYNNVIAYWTEVDGGQNVWGEPYYVEPQEILDKIGSFRARAIYVSPWKGGWWRLKDQVEYMVAVNYGVLKYAMNNREDILYNRYMAGIETIEHYKNNPPYAYVIPQEQRDPNDAVALLQRLAFNGLKVNQLSQPVRIGGKSYPVGTWVIPTSQEFGNLAVEVLGIQEYPVIESHPGGPLKRPYDVAGWTLSYSMGVQVDEIVEPLSSEARNAMEPVSGTPVAWNNVKIADLKSNEVAAGIVAPVSKLNGSGSSLALNPAVNKSYVLINKVLANNGKVIYSSKGYNNEIGGRYVVSGIRKSTLEKWAKDLNVSATWTNEGTGTSIKAPRVGVYSPWNSGFYDEGWTRWILEQHGFSLQRIRNDEMRAGNLGKKFDAIIIASISPNFIINGHSPETIPTKYAGGIGKEGVRALETFVRGGGKLVLFNQASELALEQFNIPVENAVKGLDRDQFFGSGSLFLADINQSSPVMSGMQIQERIFFNNSPVFRTKDGFDGTVLASYPSSGEILQTGYLQGENYLRGNAAALDMKLGNGNVVLFGFSPQWRGQTFNTFKMFFNALYNN